MRLYLIRHPRPDVATGICYGRSDLSVSIEEQTQALAALVPALPVGVPVFSSPLQRCLVLAEKLASALHAGAVISDARLVELDFGCWENRSWDDIARAEIDAWADDPLMHRPGGGESVLEAAVRVRAFLDAIQARRNANAIVVCHAGTIRLLRASAGTASLHQAAAEAARTMQAPAYGALSVLDI